ncbi:hypothetical protein NDU88_000848, partial [Pleurodeles waltl]
GVGRCLKMTMAEKPSKNYLKTQEKLCSTGTVTRQSRAPTWSGSRERGKTETPFTSPWI